MTSLFRYFRSLRFTCYSCIFMYIVFFSIVTGDGQGESELAGTSKIVKTSVSEDDKTRVSSNDAASGGLRHSVDLHSDRRSISAGTQSKTSKSDVNETQDGQLPITDQTDAHHRSSEKFSQVPKEDVKPIPDSQPATKQPGNDIVSKDEKDVKPIPDSQPAVQQPGSDDDAAANKDEKDVNVKPNPDVQAPQADAKKPENNADDKDQKDDKIDPDVDNQPGDDDQSNDDNADDGNVPVDGNDDDDADDDGSDYDDNNEDTKAQNAFDDDEDDDLDDDAGGSPDQQTNLQPAGDGGDSVPDGSNSETVARPIAFTRTQSDETSTSSSHFMPYFITITVIVIMIYVLYHKRHLVFALLLEGRRSGSRRQRSASGGADYRQLSMSEEGLEPGKSESMKGFVY